MFIITVAFGDDFFTFVYIILLPTVQSTNKNTWPICKPNKIPKHTPRTSNEAKNVLALLFLTIAGDVPMFSQYTSVGSGALLTLRRFPL